MVDADLLDQPADGRAHDPGVDPAQLHAADRLVGGEGGHGHRLGVALDQRSGGDHLADREPGPMGAADPAVGHVGDPGHRGQHHRWVHGQRPELEDGQDRPDERRRHRHRSSPPLAHRSVDPDPELGEQLAEEGQRQPDHVAGIAHHPFDERRGAAVDGEGPGHFQRIAGGQVGVELGIGGVGEPDLGAGHPLGLAAGGFVDHAVPGEERPRPTAHGDEPGAGLLDGGRLPVRASVEIEHRVAADDDRVPVRVGHRRRLLSGQGEHL